MDLLLFKRLKKDERDMSVHILVLHLFQINIVHFLLLLHFIWYQLLYMFTKKVFSPQATTATFILKHPSVENLMIWCVE